MGPGMLRSAKVLVVDDSLVFRDMLERILTPHCAEVVTARCCEEGKQQVEQHRDLSLVLTDVVMPDGDGFDLLEHVRERGQPRPHVILVTARASKADERRALDLGALGYLTKPTSFREISALLRRQGPSAWDAARAPRRRSNGKAFLKDPRVEDCSHLAWDVRDVSISGAFLETKGPVPVGTELEMCLVFGAAMAHVKARVTRVQEPSWAHVGGVGVRFVKFYEGARELLESYLELGDDLY